MNHFRVVTMGKVSSVVLRALTLASRAGESSWVIEVLVPALAEIDWSAGVDAEELQLAVAEVKSWGGRPQLCAHALGVLKTIFPSGSFEGFERILAIEWPRELNTRRAFELANFVNGKSLGESRAGAVLEGLARGAGLPNVGEGYAPSQFINACMRRRAQGAQVEIFFAAQGALHTLRPKQGSLCGLSSALRAWGKFCDLCVTPHFPVDAGKAAQFSAACRDPGHLC